MSAGLIDQLDETSGWLKNVCTHLPKIALVMGSGLGGVLKGFESDRELPYSEIPNVRPSTVAGHEGKLAVGRLEGVPACLLKGRIHFYEGYSMQEVAFLVRALAWSGVNDFILTNAAGGVHADMVPGDLVCLRDHINLMGSNPLIGPNDDRIGTRFPDLSDAYDPGLRKLIKEVAKDLKLPLREGVYLAIPGPTYETPSEIRMYRGLGADMVGMSTVPEAIALRHMGARVAAISCITNLAAGVGPWNGPLDHKEVLEVSKGGNAKMAALLEAVVKRVGASGESGVT